MISLLSAMREQHHCRSNTTLHEPLSNKLFQKFEYRIN
jgi:hypothetical protein